MVKGGRGPILRGVTFAALIAEPTVVRIILLVAVHALHGRTGKDGVDVTAFARDIHMPALEREGKLGMIHSTVPAFGNMTQFALRSQRAFMLVILFVAGETIRGNALVNIVLVTIRAGNGGVLAAQFEVCKFMIELCRLAPAFRVVTDTALGAKSSLVLIILGMTGIAVLGRGLQVFQITGIDMTLGTGGQRMDPQQRKGHLIVVEFRAVGVNAVMTGLAVCPKRKDVILGKNRIEV